MLINTVASPCKRWRALNCRNASACQSIASRVVSLLAFLVHDADVFSNHLIGPYTCAPASQRQLWSAPSGRDDLDRCRVAVREGLGGPAVALRSQEHGNPSGTSVRRGLWGRRNRSTPPAYMPKVSVAFCWVA